MWQTHGSDHWLLYNTRVLCVKATTLFVGQKLTHVGLVFQVVHEEQVLKPAAVLSAYACDGVH